MTKPEAAKLSTDTAAATCALHGAMTDLTMIKAQATTEHGAGKLHRSLAERIATLETAVSSLAASITTIQNRVSELLFAKKDS